MIDNAIKKVLQGTFTNDESEKEKLIKVLFLAQKHLKKHQIESVEVKYIRSNSAAGKCYGSGEVIALEVGYCLRNSVENIQIVIIHEIAHAIVGTEFGHRIEWQSKALELGLSLEHIERYKL